MIQNNRNKSEKRTLGQTIRYYRKKSGLTQEQLAERAEIDDNAISFYETDKRTPPIFNLISIAEVLGVSLDELCGTTSPTDVDPTTELADQICFVVRDVLKRYKVEYKAEPNHTSQPNHR